MARGKDTMVRENSREEIAVSDGLQLGRTTIDQTEVQTIELEVTQLKQNNAEVRMTIILYCGISSHLLILSGQCMLRLKGQPHQFYGKAMNGCYRASL